MSWTRFSALISFVTILSLSMSVRSEVIDPMLSRVTIAVDGMMKSKSGAT